MLHILTTATLALNTKFWLNGWEKKTVQTAITFDTWMCVVLDKAPYTILSQDEIILTPDLKTLIKKKNAIQPL
jgi:hypothetical protein